MLEKLQNSRNGLGLIFMLPAVLLLLLFLTYPLGLGHLAGLHRRQDRTPGRVDRHRELRLPRHRQRHATGAVQHAVLYDSGERGQVLSRPLAGAAAEQKYPLQDLLSRRHPAALHRADGAVGDRVLVDLDSQFSIISWVLVKMGVIDSYIDFLGNPWNARFSVIAANVWRGVPFVAITLLAGLQTISPSYYEASAIDGATPWQQFRHVTLPLLTPIIAVVMTFSVLFTFTDFQLIYVITRGGPLNATHLMATLAFQRAITGGALGEGAAISIAMVPFLLAAIMFSYFGLQRRTWQQGGADK